MAIPGAAFKTSEYAFEKNNRVTDAPVGAFRLLTDLSPDEQQATFHFPLHHDIVPNQPLVPFHVPRIQWYWVQHLRSLGPSLSHPDQPGKERAAKLAREFWLARALHFLNVCEERLPDPLAMIYCFTEGLGSWCPPISSKSTYVLLAVLYPVTPPRSRLADHWTSFSAEERDDILWEILTLLHTVQQTLKCSLQHNNLTLDDIEVYQKDRRYRPRLGRWSAATTGSADIVTESMRTHWRSQLPNAFKSIPPMLNAPHLSDSSHRDVAMLLGSAFVPFPKLQQQSRLWMCYQSEILHRRPTHIEPVHETTRVNVLPLRGNDSYTLTDTMHALRNFRDHHLRDERKVMDTTTAPQQKESTMVATLPDDIDAFQASHPDLPVSRALNSKVLEPLRQALRQYEPPEQDFAWFFLLLLHPEWYQYQTPMDLQRLGRVWSQHLASFLVHRPWRAGSGSMLLPYTPADANLRQTHLRQWWPLEQRGVTTTLPPPALFSGPYHQVLEWTRAWCAALSTTQLTFLTSGTPPAATAALEPFAAYKPSVLAASDPGALMRYWQSPKKNHLASWDAYWNLNAPDRPFLVTRLRSVAYLWERHARSVAYRYPSLSAPYQPTLCFPVPSTGSPPVLSTSLSDVQRAGLRLLLAHKPPPPVMADWLSGKATVPVWTHPSNALEWREPASYRPTVVWSTTSACNITLWAQEASLPALALDGRQASLQAAIHHRFALRQSVVLWCTVCQTEHEYAQGYSPLNLPARSWVVHIEHVHPKGRWWESDVVQWPVGSRLQVPYTVTGALYRDQHQWVWAERGEPDGVRLTAEARLVYLVLATDQPLQWEPLYRPFLQRSETQLDFLGLTNDGRQGWLSSHAVQAALAWLRRQYNVTQQIKLVTKPHEVMGLPDEPGVVSVVVADHYALYVITPEGALHYYDSLPGRTPLLRDAFAERWKKPIEPQPAIEQPDYASCGILMLHHCETLLSGRVDPWRSKAQEVWCWEERCLWHERLTDSADMVRETVQPRVGNDEDNEMRALGDLPWPRDRLHIILYHPDPTLVRVIPLLFQTSQGTRKSLTVVLPQVPGQEDTVTKNQFMPTLPGLGVLVDKIPWQLKTVEDQRATCVVTNDAHMLLRHDVPLRVLWPVLEAAADRTWKTLIAQHPHDDLHVLPQNLYRALMPRDAGPTSHPYITLRNGLSFFFHPFHLTRQRVPWVSVGHAPIEVLVPVAHQRMVEDQSMVARQSYQQWSERSAPIFFSSFSSSSSSPRWTLTWFHEEGRVQREDGLLRGEPDASYPWEAALGDTMFHYCVCETCPEGQWVNSQHRLRLLPQQQQQRQQ